MATMVQCPACGKLNDSRLDNCVYCGAHMKAAAGKSAAAKRSMKPCPNCGAMVADTDVICRSCNINLLTRKKVAAAGALPQPGQGQRNFMWAGVILVVALVVVGLSFLVYSLNMNDPVVKAERLIEEGKDIEAQALLRGHVESVPDDERAWYLLGRLQLNQRDYVPAADSFERVVSINPGNTDAARWALLSLASFPTEAVLPRMEDVIQQAMTVTPNDEELVVLLGLIQGVEGRIGRSASTLQDAIERFVLEDDIRLGVASLQALQGSSVQAEATLQQVNDTSLSDRRAAVSAYISLSSGRTRNAVADLEAATQSGPGVNDAQLLFELSRLYITQGKFAMAEAAVIRALDINSGHTPSQLVYAVALHAQGSDQDALSTLDQLARGSFPESASAAVLAAEIYLDMQRADRASQFLNIASQKGARDAHYLTTLGRLQMQDREFRTARVTFDRAIQSDPQFASVYLESGLLNIRLDRLAEGVKHLERYLELTRNTSVRTENEKIRTLVEQLKLTLDGSSVAGR